MKNLSSLETECHVSVTKHFQAQRSNTKKEDNYIRGRHFWSSTVIKTLCLTWFALTILFKAGSFLLITTSILYFTETTCLHEPTDRFIFKLISERLVPIVRTSRFFSLTLSLHKLPQFRDVNSKACFLVNPFFELKNADCKLCQNVQEVVDLTGLTEFEYRRKYHHNGIPFIIKDSFPTPINLNNLKKVLSKIVEFEGFPSDKYTHKELEINPTNLSRTLRNIFPAPDFLPPASELHHQQYLLFDGLLASEYSLPLPWYGNVILLQAKGQRVVKLHPVWNCRSTCSSVSVKLQPGQALYYSLFFWRATSQPIYDMKEADDFSITNIGSFSYPLTSKFN